MRRSFAEVGRWIAVTAQDRLVAVRRSDRGDVPGWVMVTLMSALLVVAILAIAQERLTTILTDALNSVRP